MITFEEALLLKPLRIYISDDDDGIDCYHIDWKVPRRYGVFDDTLQEVFNHHDVFLSILDCAKFITKKEEENE